MIAENGLLKDDKAIVSEIEGTTRDVIVTNARHFEALNSAIGSSCRSGIGRGG